MRVAPPASWWGRKFPLQQIWPSPWPLWPLTYDLDQCDLDLDHRDLNIRRWPWPTTLTFDLDHCDLDPDPRDLDLEPPFLIPGWKLEYSLFDLGDLDLWPWPSNSSEIWWPLMCLPSFTSVGPTVQPAECKQTHRHTHRRTLPKILPLTLMREVKIRT